jgi:NAD(P)H-dependent flavin oxidoreductase YrpB (nitropropane dioxygenase family)
VRQQRVALAAHLRRAWEAGDAEHGSLGTGQVCGLIDGIEPAAELVHRIAADAERILTERLASLVVADLPRANVT